MKTKIRVKKLGLPKKQELQMYELFEVETRLKGLRVYYDADKIQTRLDRIDKNITKLQHQRSETIRLQQDVCVAETTKVVRRLEKNKAEQDDIIMTYGLVAKMVKTLNKIQEAQELLGRLQDGISQ